MRAACSVVGIVIVVVCSAQPLPNTLLWRVVPPTDAAPSYLYGTMHTKDERAFQFGDSVLPALKRSAIVAGELDTEGMLPDATGMLSLMAIPDDNRLEDLYKKRDWERVKAYLGVRLGPLAAMAYRLKPVYLMALLTETAMRSDRSEVLDEHLLRVARSNGQRVIGMETPQEQFTAMDALPLKEQAALLLDHVEHDGYPAAMEAMIVAYAAQDLQGLHTAVEESGGMSEALEQALLTERNSRMVHRMDSIIHTGDNVFFLVGAAHLPGADGLLEGLRRAGYMVTPVFSGRRSSAVPVKD